MNVHVYISLSTGAKTSAECTIRVELFYACIFLFFSVPDSAPENITYKNISSGEIELSFLPPNSPNGIIQKYTIYLKKSDGNEERTINTTSLTQNIIPIISSWTSPTIICPSFLPSRRITDSVISTKWWTLTFCSRSWWWPRTRSGPRPPSGSPFSISISLWPISITFSFSAPGPGFFSWGGIFQSWLRSSVLSRSVSFWGEWFRSFAFPSAISFWRSRLRFPPFSWVLFWGLRTRFSPSSCRFFLGRWWSRLPAFFSSFSFGRWRLRPLLFSCSVFVGRPSCRWRMKSRSSSIRIHRWMIVNPCSQL